MVYRSVAQPGRALRSDVEAGGSNPLTPTIFTPIVFATYPLIFTQSQ